MNNFFPGNTAVRLSFVRAAPWEIEGAATGQRILHELHETLRFFSHAFSITSCLASGLGNVSQCIFLNEKNSMIQKLEEGEGNS